MCAPFYSILNTLPSKFLGCPFVPTLPEWQIAAKKSCTDVAFSLMDFFAHYKTQKLKITDLYFPSGLVNRSNAL